MADKPTQQAPLNPTLLPALPVARSEHEWKCMSDQQRAQLIASWQEFWLGRPTPAVNGASGVEFSRIVVEQPATVMDEYTTTANWKGPAPTREERKAMDDESWK